MLQRRLRARPGLFGVQHSRARGGRTGPTRRRAPSRWRAGVGSPINGRCRKSPRHEHQPGRRLGTGQTGGPVVGRGLRREHGRGAGLLHRVLARALAADRGFGRRPGVRRRRGARRDPLATRQPDGRAGRRRGAGAARQRAPASARAGGGHPRRGAALHRRHHRVRRAAGRARPHLACADAGARQRLDRPRARPAAVLRHDPRARLPADRVAGRQRHAGGTRAPARPGLRRLAWPGRSQQCRHRLRAGGADLRADLQADAARARALGRCLDRRAGHRAAVHARQVPDRPLHRPERHRQRLWRRRLAGGGAAVGLLLGADPAGRRRVHLGLRQHLRFAQGQLARGCGAF